MDEENVFQNVIDEQLKSLDFSQIEEIMRVTEYSGEYGFDYPGVKEILSNIISGNSVLDGGQIINSITGILFNEIFSCIGLFAEIIIICAVGGLLKSASSSFGGNTVSKAGEVICNCASVALCISNFYMMYKVAGETINTMTGFIQAMSPIMLTLMIGSGGAVSGAVINPVVLAAVNIFSTIIEKFIFPAVFMSCAFFLVNSLTENNYIKKLAGYLRKIAIFTIGLCILLFSGLTAIQGIVSKPVDGAVMKAAKYSIGNFVPIIGKFAADSIDLIRSCCGVIRGAAGVFGIIAIFVIISVPILKLIAASIVYKLAAAVSEPLGNSNISDCLGEMGNTVITLAVVVFLSALMFLIFITMFASAAFV